MDCRGLSPETDSLLLSVWSKSHLNSTLSNDTTGRAIPEGLESLNGTCCKVWGCSRHTQQCFSACLEPCLIAYWFESCPGKEMNQQMDGMGHILLQLTLCIVPMYTCVVYVCCECGYMYVHVCWEFGFV
jgi:hypothetical protein